MKHPRPIRRTAVALACLGALAAAPSAHAFSQPISELDVGAQLLDQPANQPWAVALLLGATVDTVDGTAPAPVKNIFFKFPNAKVNGNDFPTCDVSVLRAKGRGGCKSGSLIGVGTAQVDARPVVNGLVDADIWLYNGPGNNSSRKLVLHAEAKLIEVTLNFEGTLKKLSGGNFGYSFDLDIPDIPTVPGAPPAAIKNFHVTVKARGKKNGRKTSFIQAPTTCNNVLPFTAVFSYADGQKSNTASNISCILKGVKP